MKKKLLSIIMLTMLAIIITGCSSAENYDKAGKKSFENGKYEDAAASFLKAIELNSNRADYYIDYGMSLTALGKYEEALTQFDNAYVSKDMSVIKNNNKKALRGKGIAYYYMKNYEEAVKAFHKALEIDELSELNVDILYYMGSSYSADGSYQEAIDTYTNILTSDKNNAAAYAERAFCYRCSGQNEKSLKDYNSAIKIKSDNYEYYYGKYDLLIESGDTSGAKEVLAQVAEIATETDEDNYNQAKFLYYTEDYDLALTKLEECYQGGVSEAYYFIGEIYRIKKDYTQAIYYYENYINSGNVLSSNVYNQIAVCLIKTGDNKKAIEYLDKGIAYNDVLTLQILKKNEAITYENMGEFGTAQEKLKEYLKNYPEDEDVIRETEFIDTRLMDAVKE